MDLINHLGLFGWTNLREFNVQEDEFEWMKTVWLT